MHTCMCTYGMSNTPISLGRNIANLGHFGTIFYTCIFDWNVCLFHFSNENSFKLLGNTKKWCMEIGFYIFYICSLKHTFDIRVLIAHRKNLRKPAEIRYFLINQFITVNPYVNLPDKQHMQKLRISGKIW